MTSRFIRTLSLIILISLPAFLPLQAQAANTALMELIEILHNKGSLSEEEYRLLREAADAEQDQSDTLSKTDAVPTVTQPAINAEARLEITSTDQDYKFRIGGRVHFDSYFYNNDDNTDFARGTQFRRARLELENTFLKVWRTRLQYDFGGSGSLGVDGLRDAFVQYNGFNGIAITLGNQKEPFGQEEMTSSNNQNYMERSMVAGAFMPSRNPGLQVSSTIGDKVTLATGVFGVGRGNIGGGGVPGAGNDEGWSVTTRATYSPLHRSGNVIHLGLAHSHRKTNEADTTRIRTHEFGIGASTRMIDTGLFVSEGQDMLGIETGIIHGPFSATAEYVNTRVDIAGSDHGKLKAWYIEGNFILTGESRGYSFGSGTFGNPTPNHPVGQGGIGAWQLGLRYSAADLNNGTLNGGEQENLTFGLNWYPTRNLKFMANYVHVLNIYRPAHVFNGASPGVFAIRAQTYW